MKFHKYIFFFGLFGGIAINGQAQVNTCAIKHKISLQQYLLLVGKQNLGYAAAAYHINIAEAAIESAKVFPDPQLAISAFDNQQSKLQLGQGIDLGLSTTLELGGKRSARINLARGQAELDRALLQDYLRNLKADAAAAYFNAIQQHLLLQAQREAAQTMQQLADADVLRFKLGSITETDARQSKLEANTMHNVIYQNEADWKNALIKLGAYFNHQYTDTLMVPDGNFDHLDRQFNFISLINTAQNIRADAIAALNNKNVANRNLTLIKANRAIDLGISAGLTFNGESTNIDAPTPYHRTATIGLSVPLKFANHYKGDLKSAQYGIKQADIQYEEVLQQIRTEVAQAYYNYTAAQKQVKQYKEGLLDEAKKILKAKVYTYTRGETSLLEVLNAQRTFNEIQQGYYTSQLTYALALIELERSAGIWDIK